MICPICGGKTTVTDKVNNPTDNEVYRKRTCRDCGHQLYTAEIVVDKTEDFKRLWNDNYRGKKEKRT